MTVGDLVEKLGFKVVAGENALGRKVTGVYICDLLSHAMAKVNQGDLWITVHTNLNVVAVASLTDAACVLIPENIPIESQTIERADEKGVILMSGSLSAARLGYQVLSLLKDAS